MAKEQIPLKYKKEVLDFIYSQNEIDELIMSLNNPQQIQ